MSTRGAHGGYRLAADPASITAGQVLRALDEDLAPVECVAEARLSGGCDREDACSSRPLWEQVRDSVAGVLDSTTLADLCATPIAASREVPPVERKK